MSEDGPAPGAGPPLHADRPASEEPHPVKQRIDMAERQFSAPATVDPQVSGIASTSKSFASGLSGPCSDLLPYHKQMQKQLLLAEKHWHAQK